MASITIRNLDDGVKTGLRKRTDGNGRSMKEEVRLILLETVGRGTAPAKGLGTAIHELFKPFGDGELELPVREPPTRWLSAPPASHLDNPLFYLRNFLI